MTTSLPILSYVSNERLFEATLITLPAWLLLIVAPRWRGTYLTAFTVMILLSLIYVLLLVNPIQTMGFVPFIEQFLNFGDVVKAFKSPDGVVIGWIHFAVTDLAAALWLVSDSRSRRIHHLLMIPQLLVSLVFGPAGILLYLLFTRPLLSRVGEREGGLPSRKMGGNKWE